MGDSIINTPVFSSALREKAVRPESREILIAKIQDSSQEGDLTMPANCGGLGRIRHFRRETSPGWPLNPLPIDPAAHKLEKSRSDVAQAQVFQNAACNWRCWYCYVPFKLLKSDSTLGTWITPENLVARYLDEPLRPEIIDLSGGQPDLTPEWVPWMMEALTKRGLDQTTFLWSDDNLSTDYFWTKLTSTQIDQVISYRNYAKVGCFKGFDNSSFSFNTRASPTLFDQQFDLFSRIVSTGIDVYAYATFTSASDKAIDTCMKAFVDRLQSIANLLPLRVVPLKVCSFGPAVMEGRITAEHERSLAIQEEAIKCWNTELEARFSARERNLPIYEVAIR